MTITLHNFSRGARGLRLMWQCEEMGLPYRFEPVTYPPSEAYRAKNPMGTVPFLEEDGGPAINESVAIMLYLANRHGPTPLLPPATDPLHARVLQMTVFAETSIGSHVNTLLEAHFGAPEDQKANWSVGHVERRVTQALDYVEQILGERRFLAGDDLTLADIAIATSLGVWRGALKKPLPDRLVAYREHLAARPGYQRAAEAQRTFASGARRAADDRGPADDPKGG